MVAKLSNAQRRALEALAIAADQGKSDVLHQVRDTEFWISGYRSGISITIFRALAKRALVELGIGSSARITEAGRVAIANTAPVPAALTSAPAPEQDAPTAEPLTASEALRQISEALRQISEALPEQPDDSAPTPADTLDELRAGWGERLEDVYNLPIDEVNKALWQHVAKDGQWQLVDDKFGSCFTRYSPPAPDPRDAEISRLRERVKVLETESTHWRESFEEERERATRIAKEKQGRITALEAENTALKEEIRQLYSPSVDRTRQAIRALQVDTLSPLEALTKLMELKRLAQS